MVELGFAHEACGLRIKCLDIFVRCAVGEFFHGWVIVFVEDQSLIEQISIALINLDLRIVSARFQKSLRILQLINWRYQSSLPRMPLLLNHSIQNLVVVVLNRVNLRSQAATGARVDHGRDNRMLLRDFKIHVHVLFAVCLGFDARKRHRDPGRPTALRQRIFHLLHNLHRLILAHLLWLFIPAVLLRLPTRTAIIMVEL